MIGIAEFGEIVHFKAHGRHHDAKSDSAFTEGARLGSDADNSEHLIAIVHGVVKSRTIKTLREMEQGHIRRFHGIPVESERRWST